MYETPSELGSMVMRFFDPAWEPCYEAYAPHLAELNRIMMAAGPTPEGNLFTPHLAPPEDRPVARFLPKRRNFALFATTGNSMLEIGFNAGHSALLALTINQELDYVGVDIGMHAYTQPCFDYLKTLFGSRIRLHIGDSREVMPVLQGRQTFDLFHLDGGHGFGVAHADLCNILNFQRDSAGLIVDDTGHADIDAMCDYYVMRGQLSRLKLERLWTETIEHRLFRTIARP